MLIPLPVCISVYTTGTSGKSLSTSWMYAHTVRSGQGLYHLMTETTTIKENLKEQLAEKAGHHTQGPQCRCMPPFAEAAST